MDEGDIVSFSYSSSHDVYEYPSQAAYDSCDFKDATLLGGTRDSPVDVVVSGTRYIGCSKGSHCKNGQKVTITSGKALAKATTSLSWAVTDYDDIAMDEGDIVSFSYSSSHDVYEFPSQAAYDSCDFQNATLLGGTRDSPVDVVVSGTRYIG